MSGKWSANIQNKSTYVSGERVRIVLGLRLRVQHLLRWTGQLDVNIVLAAGNDLWVVLVIDAKALNRRKTLFYRGYGRFVMICVTTTLSPIGISDFHMEHVIKYVSCVIACVCTLDKRSVCFIGCKIGLIESYPNYPGHNELRSTPIPLPGTQK